MLIWRPTLFISKDLDWDYKRFSPVDHHQIISMETSFWLFNHRRYDLGWTLQRPGHSCFIFWLWRKEELYCRSCRNYFLVVGLTQEVYPHRVAILQGSLVHLRACWKTCSILVGIADPFCVTEAQTLSLRRIWKLLWVFFPTSLTMIHLYTMILLF